MFCCSFTPSQPRNALFLNKGLPKALSPRHVAISSAPKPQFTIPNWRNPSKSGKDPREERRSERHQLFDAYFYLERMVHRGEAPKPGQSTELIYDLCRFNDYNKAVRALELTVLATGRPPDGRALNFLLDQYCKRGHFEYAVNLLEKMESTYGFQPSTVTYNMLLRNLCIQGNLSLSLKLVERLVRRGRPDMFTFGFLVEAAYKERGGDEAERLLEEIVAKGGQPGLAGYNALLTGFCNEGRTDDAVRLFRSLPSKGLKPDVLSYNILLRRIWYDGQWDDCEKLLAEMVSSECPANTSTYSILIAGLVMHGRTADALQVLDGMTREGFQPRTDSYNLIIGQLCKDGNVAAAKDCMHNMIHRHLVAPDGDTYNAVAQLCHDPLGLVREAFDILQMLVKDDRSLQHFCRTIVSNLCHGGNTFPAFQLLLEMVRIGYTPDRVVYSALIRGLCYDGMPDVAMELLRIMEEEGFVSVAEPDSRPNLHNYHALATGLCSVRRTDLALGVYARMVARGFMPTEGTYWILMGGLALEDESLAVKVLMELRRLDALKGAAVRRIAVAHNLKELVDWY